MTDLTRPRFIAAAALALGLAGLASAAQAHTDVFFSVGVPIVNPAPVYVQPQPVYVQPQPVYVQPEPAYVAPPVYVAPPTRVVVRPAWGYGHEWRRAEWHREEWRRHHEREYRRHWE